MENVIENARRDALVKKEYEEYEKQLKKEREENEAPRKSVREALLGIGLKMAPSKPPVKEREKSAAESAGKAALESLKKSKESGMKAGGSVKSASARADGIAQRGKTRGKIC
jgi:HEAT repeat protein